MANTQPFRHAFLITIGLMMFLITSCASEKQVAPELIGRWTTDNPRYKDCYFEIAKDTITFFTVEGKMDINAIDKIETRLEKGLKVYQIHYSDIDDNEFRLSVLFLPNAPKGQLQFYNQKYLRWNSMGLVRQER